MSTPAEFCVWEWVDAAGDPVYVGMGKMLYGARSHPAKLLFQQRHKYDSDLNLFLRGMRKEPRRSKALTAEKLYHADAKALVFARRKQLAKKGYELLSTRPYGTKAGGGAARQVKAPDGGIYDSVRAAAERLGVNPCTITRRCSDPKSKWRYIS